MVTDVEIELQADSTGSLELVCEREFVEDVEPSIRAFSGKGEFGLLVDGLAPGEGVTLYVGEHLMDT